MLNWLKRKLYSSHHIVVNKRIVEENIPSIYESYSEINSFELSAVKQELSNSPSCGDSLEGLPTDLNTEILPPTQASTLVREITDVEPALPDYIYPTVNLFTDVVKNVVDTSELSNAKDKILNTLKNFDISVNSIAATIGPTNTLFEVVPASGIRIAKILCINEDIALALNVQYVTIAPIPEKGTVGISIPNKNRQVLSMKTVIETEAFCNNSMKLPVAFGKKSDNTDFIFDLTALPHLLVSGATGQGKSSGINAIIMSLLYKKSPSELKFVMIDTKKVELNNYRILENHFLAKAPGVKDAVITDTQNAITTLNSLCIEMDNRYDLLKKDGVRNIAEYNDKYINGSLSHKNGTKYLPFIIVVIDEYADLIRSAGEEIELPLTRLAQGARAIGIHIIIATQHPSAEVITSDIKGSFLGRIAFKVTSKINSRTILGVEGAEQLAGNGDMLISFNNEVLRVQGAFVTTTEIERIVNFIAQQPGYSVAYELPEFNWRNLAVVDLVNRDRLFNDCARLIVHTQNGSTSNMQRRFNLGYNRAGQIMDQLEAAGIVGPHIGSKPRDIYCQTESQLEQILKSFN